MIVRWTVFLRRFWKQDGGNAEGWWGEKSDRKVDKPKAKKGDQMKSGVAGADRDRIREETEIGKAQMQQRETE